MKIINLKEVNKGALKYLFTVHFEKMGLFISCTFMQKENSKWIGMPSKPFEKDGQTKYQWLTWFYKDTHKRFESAVVKLIEEGKYERAEVAASKPDQAPSAFTDDDIPF